MIYLVLALVLLFLIYGPQLWIRHVMWRHSTVIEGMPGTGGELAEHLVDQFNLEGVTVERTQPWGDHYDPSSRTVRLSPQNFDGKSLTAVAVAVHEIGHALQHQDNDRRLIRRVKLAPIMRLVEQTGTGLLVAAPVLGMLLRTPAPVLLLAAGGLAALFARVVLHTMTLPVEFDASFNRALPIIHQGRYVSPQEEPAVRQVLQAAALTYVASALADVLSIWRWLWILRRG